MENIIRQINELAEESSEAERRDIQDALIKVQHSLETPFETIMRVYNWDFQAVGSRIAADLGLFKTLTEHGEPMTLQQLAEKTGGSPSLLGRILRYLASVNLLVESDKDIFMANATTRTLSDHHMQGGIYLSFNVQSPTNHALPDLLLQRGYQDINSNTDTAFNEAQDTSLPFFVWAKEKPIIMDYLHRALQITHRGDWLSRFPLEKYLGTWASSTAEDRVLFVDVGGSMGIQCVGLKTTYPHVKGRVILQDMKEAIELVKPIQGVEIMAQDFYKPQAVSGAKFYYHRNIFHDYPDTRCLQILEVLIPAMNQDSLILIDDKVLPERGVHRHVAMMDIAMMAQVASRERNIEQWRSLLAKGGCEIVDIVSYTDEYDSVLVVRPKKREYCGLKTTVSC